ncbi:MULTISPECIES: hypothetical protein [unclassified Photobacterium]|uniref:hypothetical protein n=1 Tax=unclassified Photobacterium TaxID=2628852 RepID=UPI001EDE021E|nr:MULTISPECIES: hypothetical protein [unclassified Photobacterium]MCG3863944.1 hypothetical protein [Photobacterium sp. Ph6]MCG3875528.1 hypothetical protein [Photobacterium sp. Ph5]
MKRCLFLFLLLLSPSVYSLNNQQHTITSSKPILRFNTSACATLFYLSTLHAGLCKNKALNHSLLPTPQPSRQIYQEANIAIYLASGQHFHITSYTENDSYGVHFYIPMNMFN